MHVEHIEFLFKTAESWSGNSPAVYKAKGERGGYVIQGWSLDEATVAQLRNRAPGEIGIWVPDDIVEGLKGL